VCFTYIIIEVRVRVMMFIVPFNNISASLSMTTKVVSSSLVHDVVYSIKLYVIKFISDLRQVSGFLRYSGFLH
jgi:hypothetical protein